MLLKKTWVKNDIYQILALMGVQSFSTMKVVGSVSTRQLHILIDYGSTHNFINARTNTKLCCIQKDLKPLSVSVANGFHLSCILVYPTFQ